MANWLFMKTKILLPLLMLVIVILAFRKKESFTVKGSVTDTNGIAIAGASVMEMGKQNGTTADARGNYSITVSSKNAKLVFSAVGYESKSEQVNGKEQLNVILKASVAGLTEVVVTGHDKLQFVVYPRLRFRDEHQVSIFKVTTAIIFLKISTLKTTTRSTKMVFIKPPTIRSLLFPLTWMLLLTAMCAAS